MMYLEQHRYAVERAAERMRKIVEAAQQSEEELRCISLQGEAARSDLEMLVEVAEFLQTLEGSKPSDGTSIQAFSKDLQKMMMMIAVTATQYGFQNPEIIFNREWQIAIRQIPNRFDAPHPTQYYGIRIRFGQFEQATGFRDFGL